MPKKARNKKGNLLVLIILSCSCLSVVVYGLYLCQMMFLQHQRAQAAAQAAVLEAASNLSKIVIEDPEWGYISLSNHPASGNATKAPDGEPLPVVSINNIKATVRLEKLVAMKLRNQKLNALAEEDYAKAAESSKRLQAAIDKALSGDGDDDDDKEVKFTDFNGESITPYLAAQKMFAKNFPDIQNGKASLSDLKIKTGWLSSGSLSVTPNPFRKASEDGKIRDFCPSFVDLKTGNQDYYFAGVSDAPALVSRRRFQDPDGKRFCSAVLLTARIDYLKEPIKVETEAETAKKLKKKHDAQYVKNYTDDKEEDDESSSISGNGLTKKKKKKLPEAYGKNVRSHTTETEVHLANEKKDSELKANNISYSIYVGAVALPPSAPDQGAAGALVVSFPQGMVGRFSSLSDMLTDIDLSTVGSKQCFAMGGDYPKDREAVLHDPEYGKISYAPKVKRTISDSIAQTIVSWIRTDRGRSRLDEVVKAIKTPFDKQSEMNRIQSFVIYDFNKNGGCVIEKHKNKGFFRHTVSEKQTIDTAFDIAQTERGMLGIIVRNQVLNHSLANGGKHAGQPLFSELPINYDMPSSREKEIINADNELLEKWRKQSPKKIDAFRRSYLKGGLAASVEVLANQRI